MDNNKMTSDDLRGMLDEYSPEQQMEINAKTVSEGAKSLAEAASIIKDYMTKHSSMVEEIKSANTLCISDETETNLVKEAEAAGVAVAEAFKKSVEPTIRETRRKTNYVFIPSALACILLWLLLSLFVFSAFVIIANHLCWNNTYIWKILLYTIVFFIVLSVISTFLYFKGWIK